MSFSPGVAVADGGQKLLMNDEAHPISIDPRSGSPFYRQIIDRVLMAIASGDLRPGQQLPTVRQLAIDLHVNPNTVSRAYRELEIRQVVTTQRGTGTFVAADPGIAEDAAKRAELLEKFCDDTVAEAGRLGFSLKEVVEALHDRFDDRR
jgi:GntR family transcriptional regulator